MLKTGPKMNWTARTGLGAWWLLAIVLVGAQCLKAQTPAVTASILTTISTTGIAAPESFVQDSCGNLFVLDEGNELWEVPAAGGAATSVESGSEGYANQALAIDSNNNLYVTGPNYSGNTLMIPEKSCAPQPGSATSVATPGAAQGYWYFAEGIAVDASNNLFIIGSNNQIMESTPGGTVTTVVNSSCLPTSVALDPSENLYYTCGANPAAGASGNGNSNNGIIYQLAFSQGAFAVSPTTWVTTNLTNAYGLAFDKNGNLFVVDQGSGILYEIPVSPETGALAPSLIFPVVSSPAPGYRVNIGNDGKTLLYPAVFGANTNLYELASEPPDFGSVAIGSTSTESVNLSFFGTFAPASVAVTSAAGVFTQGTGGTCIGSFSSGTNCTVNVTFAPTKPGRQNGSVLLLDANGNQLVTADISGTGVGAGLTVDPGTIATVGSGYSAPKSVAIDYAGDLFIADSAANKVWEIAAGGSTATAIGSGFSGPQGVAVDGAGNVYVADTGNDQIVEIPVVNGALSTTAQTTLIKSTTSVAGAKLDGPEGIAIDGLGNLYIADSGNKRVVDVPYLGSWDFALAQNLGSQMSEPSAIAVDSAGDVYVADAGNGDVYELSAPLSSGVQVTVATGYTNPSGVALDASGALFVVDKGDKKVWRIPNVSGTLAPSSALNVIGQLNASGTAIIADPFGVAADTSGNIYVTDSTNAAAYVVGRTSSTQSAGTWSPDTSSGTLTYYLENEGNSSLTFGSPYETATGDTTQFSLLSSESDACASGGSVSVGTSCDVEAVFAPMASGNFTYTLALNSNAANASGEMISFTGVGAATVTTTTTVTQTSPSGSPSYDQAVTFGVTVSSATGTPVGGVSLTVDGITKQTVTLSNGSATITLLGGVLSGGSHTVAAQYVGGNSGGVTYSASTSSPLTVTVLPVSTSTALSYATLYTSPASQPAGSPLVFTATISTAYAGVPTGQVTFTITDSSGNLATGTGTLEPASGGTFQATYTYANTASPSGAAYDVESVTATYSGDENFSGSASASSSFDVSAAGGAVTMTPSTTSLTSSANSDTSVTFNATSYGGWNGLVGFSCLASSLPANARCVFSPGQIEVLSSSAASTASNPPITMTVTIDQPPQTTTASKFIWWVAGPAGLLLFFARRRFARHGGAIAAVLAFLLIGIAVGGLGACTSGPKFTTPAGTSTVTVYASSDPFASAPSSSTPTPATQPCPASNPANAPCVQQSFQISLTVQ
jgi:sugar lactone lactonase YvrE